jgi:hypothetical protein
MQHSIIAGRERWSLLALALLVVAGGIAAAVWVTVPNSNRTIAPPTATPAAQPLAVDAAAWIRTNLPTNSRLLTDGVVAPGGYPTASLGAAESWRDFDYLLTTHADAPSPDAAAAPVLQSSLAAAIFDGLQVRRIVAGASGDVESSRQADLDARLRAGAALAQNPNVEVLPGASPALSRGLLDLRAASVISGLAAQMDLTLDAVNTIAPEARAGVPARALTIYTTDPVQTTRLLIGFDAALRPDRVDVGEGGAVNLHWPLSFDPVPAVK